MRGGLPPIALVQSIRVSTGTPSSGASPLPHTSFPTGDCVGLFVVDVLIAEVFLLDLRIGAIRLYGGDALVDQRA